MSTHKHFEKLCVAVTALALLLTIAFMNGERLGVTKVIDQDRENNSDSVYFTTNDQWSDWSTEDATTITLNGDSAKVSGAGAYADGANVVIKQSGFYAVSGVLTGGNLTVDADSSSKVWILLNGADITCADDAALRVEQADKVFLTLAEGTENSLQSGESMSETALADGTDGAIFAHDDLTINGGGSLMVTAGYKHGIAANDDLVIAGGVITVTAPQDAIHANDSLRIRDAAIIVDAGDDGLATSNEGAYLYLASGEVKIQSEDDGIHIAGDIIIDGGTITIDAGNDGIHSDAAITINGGDLLLQKCYEGVEGKTIDVNGGDITVYPTDDGFNANGGSSNMMGFPAGFGGMRGNWNGGSESAESGQPALPTGGETPAAPTSEVEDTDEETYIRITGGNITIINETAQDADGLDSNGSIYIDGGYILISLSGNGSNNAIDYGSESDGVAEITGGTVIACGGSVMAEGFSTNSTQGSIFYTLNTVAAGTNLTVKNSAGQVLLTWDVPASYSAVTVSCPEMTVGETYQIVTGSTVQEVTLDSIAVTVGNSAGGFGSMGGMRGGWNTSGAESTDGTTNPGFDGGMEGGHGGPGGRMGDKGTRPDRQSTTTDGISAATNGKMPDFSDGEFTPGENFDPSQMGEPPEGFDPSQVEEPSEGFDPSQMEEPPAMPSDGEKPDFSQMGQRPDRNVANAETEESVGEATAEANVPQAVSPQTWMTMGICVLVLLAGLVVGFAWKKHG